MPMVLPVSSVQSDVITIPSVTALIGVSLASRKVRGGMGLHIGIGISLSFAYIMFMTISTTFAISGNMSPLLAVWLPNIIFAVIGVVLYYKAPK